MTEIAGWVSPKYAALLSCICATVTKTAINNPFYLLPHAA